MTPDAANLFLNVWCQACSSERHTQPGSAEWANQRQAMREYWAAVWADCLDLAEFIESGSSLGANAVSVVTAEPEP